MNMIYTVDDWKRVLWSDETKIFLHGSDGHGESQVKCSNQNMLNKQSSMISMSWPGDASVGVVLETFT
jgi:hypothetical protein